MRLPEAIDKQVPHTGKLDVHYIKVACITRIRTANHLKEHNHFKGFL